ncbi:MAG: T9SS type A sorting domain-containing protein [Bacteroidetes bacterium]|nr:T9SS type A sorting domain-containing protein [Bacteroidota bacterium]
MKKALFTLLGLVLSVFMTNEVICQNCDFSAGPRTGTAPFTVYFTPQVSIPSGLTLDYLIFVYGDGENSGARYSTTQVSHTYTVASIYQVTLIAYAKDVWNGDRYRCIVYYEDLITVQEQQNSYPTIVLSQDTLNFSYNQFDTLLYDNNESERYSNYRWEPNRRMGMRMSPSGPCTIHQIQVYCGKLYQEFKIGIYDFDNRPGNALYESYTLSSENIGWNTIDVSSRNIKVEGDFLASFNTIDTIATLGYNKNNSHRAWDYDGTEWSQFDETYFINAIVRYNNTSQNPKCSFKIKNAGLADLNITNIISDNDWIVELNPVILTIKNNEEKDIYFTIDANKADYGLNFGRITVSSNDPENPIKEIFIIYEKSITGIENTDISKQDIIRLSPNPAYDNVDITYNIFKASSVTLSITDNLGKNIVEFINNEYYEQGSYNKIYNLSYLSSGVYYCTLKTDGYTETVKLYITK